MIELTASDSDKSNDKIDDHRTYMVNESFNGSFTNIQEAHQNKGAGITADSIEEPSSVANLIEMPADSLSYHESKGTASRSSL